MTEIGREKTALGIARARFMDALPRKAKELRSAIATLAASPEVARLREEMRRRLHALYASAQVFHEEALASSVKRAIDRIDRARDEQRPLGQEDIDELTALADSMPRLRRLRKDTPSVVLRPSLRTSMSDSLATPSGFSTTTQSEPAPRSIDSDRIEAIDQTAELPERDGTEEEQQPSERLLINLLVVDEPEFLDQIGSLLPVEQFEVQSTSDPEEALRLARSSAPDIALISRNILLKPEGDLIGRLRSDPLTGFIPVILILESESADDADALSQINADKALTRPLDATLLLRTIIELVDQKTEPQNEFEGITEATVDDIANRVAAEIRRGLTESLRTGQDQRIPLGDSPEILAATWSTIGRIRSHLSHRSGGSVQFRDAPLRGGPALLALSDEEDLASSDPQPSNLEGRRILVTDDDPAVLWFFSGLLLEAGATVVDAKDGKEALEKARTRRPDVIISDILMPEIDGFTLCRELKSDVFLADVPVILLSWKEDYIQRMHELSSGASGYLLKESGSHQILKCIYDVLRPRTRLENQLCTDAEVRGRLDRIGVLGLLEIVAKKRPDARIVLRDARNLFEIDIRQGNLVELTQTASDGSFLRGEEALQRLLEVVSGRYTVTHSTSPVRNRFQEPLHQLLHQTANRLGALLDCVSNANLMQVKEIAFDRDLLKSILEVSPKSAHEIVACLEKGQSPQETIVAGRFAPQQLESLFEDLARRGAITGVFAADGSDMIAKALRVREQSPSTLIYSTPPSGPEPGTGDPMEWLLGPSGEETPDAQSLPEEAKRTAGTQDPSQPATSQSADTAGQDSDLDASETETQASDSIEELPEVSPALEEVASQAELTWEEEQHDSGIDRAPSTQPPNSVPVGKVEIELSPESAKEASVVVSGKPPPVPTDARPHKEQRVPLSQPLPESKSGSQAETALDESRLKNDALESDTAALFATENESDGRIASEVLRHTERSNARPEPSAEPDDASHFDQPQEAKKKKSGLIIPLMLISIFAAVLLGWKMLGVEGAGSETERWGQALTEDTVIEGPKPEVLPEKDAEGAKIEVEKGDQDNDDDTESAETEEHSDDSNHESEAKGNDSPDKEAYAFGRSLPFIDQTRNVKVGDDQGLLVVEFDSPVDAPLVRIGKRNLGRAPIDVALSAGRHELIFDRNGETSYRYVVVSAGKTLIVKAP